MTDGDDEVGDATESNSPTQDVSEETNSEERKETESSEQEQAEPEESEQRNATESESSEEETEDTEESEESEESEENTEENEEAEDSTQPDGGTAQAEVSDVEQTGEQSESEASGAFEGAPDDEEMPLTEHIEEMLKRLAAVIVVMGGVSLIIFPVAPDLINRLWYSFLPGNPENCLNGNADSTACPRVYHPLGLLFARIKVASLAGFIIALPVFVYQTYLFMRPGLYPHERRYYLAAVPTSLVLALVGLAFAYFLVLPFIFTYFLFYSEDVADIAFGLTETFDLILLMMGLFAAIFQIPLFIMLAIMMGVTTRRWLEEKRYYFWLGFAGFAFLFSPDPTGMAPFMVGITMVILYELTLLLLRWTGR